MISIATYSKAKSTGNGGSGGSGGGGFNNTTINYKGIEPHYLWGNYFDGTQDISGNIDLSKGKITAKEGKFQELEANIATILSAYTQYIQAQEANVGNLSASGNTSLKNTDIDGTLDVGGESTFSGDATFNNDVTISGDTHVTDLYSNNITNSDMIKTKNLEVTGKAHFFELIIDKIKAAGGAVLLTPADGFKVDIVEPVTNGYNLYFRSDDEEGHGIMNMWEIGDQAICQSFNRAVVGVSYDVSNKYYWSLVTGKDEEPVQKTVSGETHDYHYITISNQEGTDSNGVAYYDGVVEPEPGDEVAMLGYRGTDDEQRQCALYLAAYQSIDLGLTAPLFAEYKGINNFDLASHRSSYIDANTASFKGELRVENGQTVENYVSGQTTIIKNELKFDIDGLTSKVSKISRPNICPSNEWKDYYDEDVFQEDDEEYKIAESGETYAAAPPVIYLDEGNYTMSAYATAKYDPIAYGATKENLDQTLEVETMINPNDTWHNNRRSQTTFHAPIDGWYHIQMQMMDDSYSGDTPYHEYEDPEDPSSSGSSGTVQTQIEYTLPMLQLPKGTPVSGTTSILPVDYVGGVLYQSSNPSIATVDGSGTVTGIADGSATITATATEVFHNGKHYLSSSDTQEITISSNIQTSITATASKTSLNADSDRDAIITVIVTPSYYPGEIIFTSSDSNVLAVDSDGNVTALEEGEAYVTVSVPTITVNGTTFQGSSTTIYFTVSCIAPETNEIWYTTEREKKITTKTDDSYFNSNITGNTYNEYGVLYFDAPVVSSVAIPSNSVTGPFYGNTLLKTMELPPSMTTVGKGFAYDNSIRKIILHNGTQSIGYEAFCDSNLREIKMPSSITTLEESAFASSKVEKIKFSNNITSVAGHIFEACSNLETVTIPHITTIGGSSFRNTSSTSYPDNKLHTVKCDAEYVGDWTFGNDKELHTVIFGEHVNYLGGWAFKGCTGLRRLIFKRNTPPSYDSLYYDTVFDNVDKSNVVIYVPNGKVRLYQASPLFTGITILEVGDTVYDLPNVDYNIDDYVIEINEPVSLPITSPTPITITTTGGTYNTETKQFTPTEYGTSIIHIESPETTINGVTYIAMHRTIHLDCLNLSPQQPPFTSKSAWVYMEPGTYTFTFTATGNIWGNYRFDVYLYSDKGLTTEGILFSKEYRSIGTKTETITYNGEAGQYLLSWKMSISGLDMSSWSITKNN